MRKSLTQITLKEKLFGFHNHHDDVEDFFLCKQLNKLERHLEVGLYVLWGTLAREEDRFLSLTHFYYVQIIQKIPEAI